MRWKATFFLNKDENEHNPKEHYGLKSKNTPKPVKELMAFENDMFDIVKQIKFRKTISPFQNILNNDLKSMKHSTKTLTKADKTSNMYKLDKEQYTKLVTEAVTKTYKISHQKISNVINIKGKEILKDTSVLQRMDKNNESSCFVTLKDHKENFENRPTVRL